MLWFYNLSDAIGIMLKANDRLLSASDSTWYDGFKMNNRIIDYLAGERVRYIPGTRRLFVG